jgi:hypothetical protein
MNQVCRELSRRPKNNGSRKRLHDASKLSRAAAPSPNSTRLARISRERRIPVFNSTGASENTGDLQTATRPQWTRSAISLKALNTPTIRSSIFWTGIRESMMNAPILQILWLYRRLFLGVMCLTFLALAIAIFLLPKPRVTIRSSIEIGSTVINGNQVPLEQPEQVAKRIASVYAPPTLLTMAKKGTPPSVLSALQNSSAENIGPTIVVISAIDPRAENEAREFQEAVAAQIIKEQALPAQILREDTAVRIASATEASENFQQEIKAISTDIEHINALSEGLRAQIENQQANLTTLHQRVGAAQQPSEHPTPEAEIRELYEQALNQTSLLVTLTLERVHLTRNLARTHRQYQAQIEALANAQLEEKRFIETHVSLPPSLMPAATNSRRIDLLLIAAVVSILIAFGTVVLLHNMGVREV